MSCSHHLVTALASADSYKLLIFTLWSMGSVLGRLFLLTFKGPKSSCNLVNDRGPLAVVNFIASL